LFNFLPMTSLLLNPWPWWLAGPLIGLTVGLLLIFGGRSLGVSSTFRHLCTLAFPKSRLPYLAHNDVREKAWSLLFVLGIALGAFIAVRFLSAKSVEFLPAHYHTYSGALKLLAGGVLIGFGTRWARGCTSGHAIMGLASLQKPSLYAVLSFFAGGLLAAGIALVLNGGLS
jgi:uncharacterized membrane protein YedE/YeeE